LYITEESAVVKALGSEGFVAIKVVMDKDIAQHEISLLSQLQHPHIIRLLDHFRLPKSCGKYKHALVFNLYESGVAFKPTSKIELHNFMHQLLQVLLSRIIQ
jgi:serine/threonine protein kinase